MYNAAGKSSVIDFYGQVMADAGFYRNTVVTHTIRQFCKTQPDWFYQTAMTGEPDLRKRRDSERRPDLCGALGVQGPKQGVPEAQRKEELRGLIRSGKVHW